MLFKKLHINVLSIALLVSLVSYSGNENPVLPQQFSSEYVVFTDVVEDVAFYGISIHSDENFFSSFTEHDNQEYLRSTSNCQLIDFKVYAFKGKLLKEHRQLVDFKTELSSFSKDLHAYFI